MRHPRGPDQLESGQNISLMSHDKYSAQMQQIPSMLLKRTGSSSNWETSHHRPIFFLFTVTFEAEDFVTDIRDLHVAFHHI